MRKKKEKSNAWWKKEFWKTFSLYIRTRDKFRCFTCGRLGGGSGLHAGHYVPRSVGGLSLYFHEQNVHAQCYHCNINLGGFGAMYHIKMIEKYGQEVVNELWRLKDQGFRKIEIEEYKRLIVEYKEKTAHLYSKQKPVQT